MPKSLCIALAFLLVAIAPTRAQDSSATSQPALITLKLESTHPRDAIAELAKQAGVSLAPWPEQLWEQNRNLPTSISLDIDGKSFWTALDALCTAAHLQPANTDGHGGLSLQQSDGQSVFRKRPQSVSGLATVVADSVQRNHTLSLDSDNPQAEHNCGLSLTAYVAPRLRLLKYHPQPTVEAATDESGKSIAAQAAGQPGLQDAAIRWQLANLSVPLDYDAANSHTLAALKGSISVTVAAEVEMFELDDLANAQGTDKTVAGRRITVDQIKDENHNFTLTLTLVRTDLSKEEFQQIVPTLFRAITFKSADDKTVSGGGSGGGDGEKITYNFNFSYNNDSDKPAKLLWEIPTKIEDIELPFEFHDIPLP